MTYRVYSKQMCNCARTLRRRSTPQEAILWRYLRNRRLGAKFRRQLTIDNKYVVDFVCLEKKIIIEVDGSQHSQNPTDADRTKYLKRRGFDVLRFWNNEIDNQLLACLEVIYNKCGASPSPALRASSPSRGEEKTD